MLRLLLITFISLLFISCTKESIVIKTIGKKPLKEMSIKTISRVTIPTLEDGYKNFSTTVISSQKEMKKFLSKVKLQKGWKKRDNFIKSVKSQKIDFSHYNLLMYRIDKLSNADVLLVGLPKGDKKIITIKIGVDESNSTKSKLSHYAIAYKISKTISKIKFKNGVEEDVIKNSSSQLNSDIPESCMEWFDGCNSCKRALDNDTPPSCTELSCKVYDEFKCTKWRESVKQLKLDNAPSHHDSELDSLPRSVQFANE